MRPRLFLLLFVVVIGLMLVVASAQEASPGYSSSKARQKTEQHVKSPPGTATEDDQSAYHNSEFGFTYHIPFGWVDRTRQMQPDPGDAATSQLLLAMFERPPEATGDSVNSAVIITAEKTTSYPGLKTATDYMGPLTELTTSKGFKAKQEPYEFPVGAKALVRGDFSKDLGKLTMYQSSLVMLYKGSLVTFTFIGGSDDEVGQLIEKLRLSAAKKSR